MSAGQYQKSVDFLLENAGPVIQYRLRKEILGNLGADDEARLLTQIYALPLFTLLKKYIKPNGYIGRGMHSWDNWRGVVLHETPLENAECAARLLSYYRIPKNHPFVSNFVGAMRDEQTLREEFSYIPPEIPRFERRFEGLNNGNSLMALLYTMQAMLGFGDDYDDLRDFQQTALQGFRRVQKIGSLQEITKVNDCARRKYNYPYIESDEYLPNAYTVEMLAYTQSWRTAKNIRMLADALNNINLVMRADNNIHVRIGGKYAVPCFALVRPIRAFHADLIDSILYRRILTEIAMTGVGRSAEVIRQSAMNITEAIDKDGILRMDFSKPHNKSHSPRKIVYPTAYSDVRLEADYKNEKSFLCDLTFWAVEFLHLADSADKSL